MEKDLEDILFDRYFNLIINEYELKRNIKCDNHMKKLIFNKFISKPKNKNIIQQYIINDLNNLIL